MVDLLRRYLHSQQKEQGATMITPDMLEQVKLDIIKELGHPHSIHKKIKPPQGIHMQLVIVHENMILIVIMVTCINDKI